MHLEKVIEDTIVDMLRKAVSTLPQDVYLAKGKLESEGIEVFY